LAGREVEGDNIVAATDVLEEVADGLLELCPHDNRISSDAVSKLIYGDESDVGVVMGANQPKLAVLDHMLACIVQMVQTATLYFQNGIVRLHLLL